MRHHGKTYLIVWTAVVALIVAGCGPGPGASRSSDESQATQVYAKFAHMAGAKRHDALIKAARQEGTLVLYTSNSDYHDLVNNFKKDYPGIDVQSYRASSEKVLQRTLQEGSAHKTANDMVETNKSELDIMASKQLFGRYKSTIRNSLRPIARQKNWTANRINAFTVGWNTDAVPRGQQPTSYLDLAEPNWKGKLSMEEGDSDWYGALYTYLSSEKHMSKAQIDGYFKKLANNAKVAKGHTVQGQLLSAGQFGVAMSPYKHTLDRSHFNKNAPVDWQPAVQPLFLRPNGQGLMKDAQHPAAALLYMDWMLTEGQKSIVKSFRVPVRKHVAGEKRPIPPKVDTYPVPDDVDTHDKKWSARYDKLLRGVS